MMIKWDYVGKMLHKVKLTKYQFSSPNSRLGFRVEKRIKLLAFSADNFMLKRIQSKKSVHCKNAIFALGHFPLFYTTKWDPDGMETRCCNSRALLAKWPYVKLENELMLLMLCTLPYYFIIIIIFNKFILFYLFLAALGLCCCTRTFSSCSRQGLLFVVVCGLLIAVASLVAEHRL